MLDSITNVLPPSWRPFAKFMWPSIGVVLATLVYALIDGQLDKAQLEVGLVGVLTAAVAFATSNGSEGWRVFAKAVASAFTALGIVVIQGLLNGFDETTLRLAISGFATAVFVYLIPNLPVPSDTPVTPPGVTNLGR